MTISAKNETTEELETVKALEAVCEKYTIPSFTDEVVVEKEAIPHSHPVLTLNTRDTDERLLLKKLVHEQFHWYAQEHPNYHACIAYLKTKYENDGEHNKSGKHPDSYWEHIIVCFNTRACLRRILPDEDIAWIYEQWQPYPTLEKLIVERYEEVETDLQKFDIVFAT